MCKHEVSIGIYEDGTPQNTYHYETRSTICHDRLRSTRRSTSLVSIKKSFWLFFHSIAKHSAVHGISKLSSLSLKIEIFLCLKIPLDSLILEILENYDSGVSIFPRDFRASCLNGEWCGDSWSEATNGETRFLRILFRSLVQPLFCSYKDSCWNFCWILYFWLNF